MDRFAATSSTDATACRAIRYDYVHEVPKKRLNVLLVGEESAGIDTLKALARSDHRVVAVMASPPRTPPNRTSSLWQVGQQMGYPTWPAALVKDPAFARQVESAEVDLILNVHSLYIMNADVLSASRLGSFNLHPGPLPRYAGLNAVSWAIYHGEKTHGVTLHKIVPAIDAGPIVYQSSFNIDESDTALTVFTKCHREGLTLIVRLLETASMKPDAIPLVPQDLTQRKYFGRGVPDRGRLSWSLPALAIVNWVRACDFFPFRSPWPYPRATMGDAEIGIVKARLTRRPCEAPPGTVGSLDASGAYLACADEWIVVSKLTMEGRYVNPSDVLKCGDQLQDGRWESSGATDEPGH